MPNDNGQDHPLTNPTPVVERGVHKWVLDLELMKAFGLFMSLLMFVGGRFLSAKFTFCDACKFDMDKTYIVQLFGFTHNCTYIDENPTKSIAAIMCLGATTPLMIYTYLDKVRVELDYLAGKRRLKNAYILAKYTWHLRFCSFLLFFLVFVNTPVYDPQPFIDPSDPDITLKELFANEAWVQFLLHYTPFFFWQLALALMAIEQTLYHHDMNTMPFNPPKTVLKIYCCLTFLVFIYYTVWIVGFLFGFYVPGHTYHKEDNVVMNKLWAQSIMWLYSILAILLPLIMSMCRSFGIGCRKTADHIITFSPLTNEENIIGTITDEEDFDC